MPATSKGHKNPKPQLRVAFDTNILYTGSASDLIQQEATKLIQESVFPDLEIEWYLPDIVRHERQYQMQKRAADLLPALAKVEKLLGHNLGITESILIDRVAEAVRQRCDELKLLSLGLSYADVDWNRVALDAVYRRAPFEDGEKEKGFRDCVVVESFLQLVANSPKTPSVCRIVLLTKDGLVAHAAKARTAECSNVSVLSTLDELKGLINTLVSQVSEDFLATLKPKAQKLFFLTKDESTLFYKAGVRELLEERYKAELSATPAGATSRKNGTWGISPPNFVKKTGKRIQWSSRIAIESESSKGSSVTNWATDFVAPLPKLKEPSVDDYMLAARPFFSKELRPLSDMAGSEWYPMNPVTVVPWVTTHKGSDIYEVYWSADVTTSRELRKPSIDDIKHLGLQWEPVS